jgi:hypothetical protein
MRQNVSGDTGVSIIQAFLQSGDSFVYGDHLAWPLVVCALLVIAKR